MNETKPVEGQAVWTCGYCGRPFRDVPHDATHVAYTPRHDLPWEKRACRGSDHPARLAVVTKVEDDSVRLEPVRWSGEPGKAPWQPAIDAENPAVRVRVSRLEDMPLWPHLNEAQRAKARELWANTGPGKLLPPVPPEFAGRDPQDWCALVNGLFERGGEAHVYDGHPKRGQPCTCHGEVQPWAEAGDLCLLLGHFWDNPFPLDRCHRCNAPKPDKGGFGGQLNCTTAGQLSPIGYTPADPTVEAASFRAEIAALKNELAKETAYGLQARRETTALRRQLEAMAEGAEPALKTTLEQVAALRAQIAEEREVSTINVTAARNGMERERQRREELEKLRTALEKALDGYRGPRPSDPVEAVAQVVAECERLRASQPAAAVPSGHVLRCAVCHALPGYADDPKVPLPEHQVTMLWGENTRCAGSGKAPEVVPVDAGTAETRPRVGYRMKALYELHQAVLRVADALPTGHMCWCGRCHSGNERLEKCQQLEDACETAQRAYMVSPETASGFHQRRQELEKWLAAVETKLDGAIKNYAALQETVDRQNERLNVAHGTALVLSRDLDRIKADFVADLKHAHERIEGLVLRSLPPPSCAAEEQVKKDML